MRGRLILCSVILSLLWLSGARAVAPAKSEFFKNKTITIVTSTGPGGSYDLIARLLASVMPRFIPGHPSMIVENMPGGGNLTATNYMYSIAPKDGTTIATIHAAMPLYQVLDGRGVRFKADRFNWLGSTGPENEVILVWRTSGVTTFQQATERPIILGSTGTGSGLFMIPMAMDRVLGAKFKIVVGYKSSEDLNIALERGEVQARAFSMGSILAEHRDWVTDHKVAFIAQAGAERESDLPDTPLLTELAKTGEQREIMQLVSSPPGLGHPFLAPPGVPRDRLRLLEQAFQDALRDKDFIAEVGKLQIGVRPMTGDDVAKIVRETVEAPSDIIAKTRAAVAASR